MNVCYSNRFISNELKTFVQKNGVKHIFTAPYQPSSNGMAERSFQVLKCAIKKIIEGKNLIELNTIVSGYLLHYIATPQSTTGKSLAEMLFNRKLNTRHNLLKQSMNKPDLNNEQQIAEFCALKTSRAFHLKGLVWYWINQLGETNYTKTIRTCYISNRQFPEHFQKHNDQLRVVYTNIEVDNESICETNSSTDSNNQILSKPRDSNGAPPIDSNIESSIICKNGTTIPISQSNISPTLTPVNSNNQDDISDLSSSPPLLCISERIRKPPPNLKDYSLQDRRCYVLMNYENS